MATLLNNAGRAIITSKLQATSFWIGWGTGAGAVGAANTSLSTESVDESRAATTNTQQTTSVTNDTARFVATMTCAVTGKTITNAGVFDASSSGNMLMSTDGIATALAVTDSIAFTFNLQF